jgi:hypothetical protein
VPIITLTTDFGLSDAYVGVMKGVILSIAPRAVLVDLCHEVPAQDVRAAAFALYQAAPFFPADTVHLAVVDPGVGSSRRALAVHTDRGTFVAPDNGLLSLVLEGEVCHEAVTITSADFRLPGVSTTFHGRDIFAPAAAHLANGVPLSHLGSPAGLLVRLQLLKPEVRSTQVVVAHVLHVDRFGNLVLDVRADRLPHRPVFEIAGRVIGGLSGTYADAAPGELVAYVGSTHDLVEIAVRNGDAAQATGAGVGAQVLIRRRA